MGTSVTKSYNTAVRATLVMVVILLGTCASGANATLRVRNDLEFGNITVWYPPGCCSPCVTTTEKFCPKRSCAVCATPVTTTGDGKEVCADVCEVCGDDCVTGIVVESGQEVSLDGPNVGQYPASYLRPYPPSYLKVQVQDKVYCVPEADLRRLTRSAELQVGAGDCSQHPPDVFSAVINDDTSPYVTCLQSCG